MEFSTGYVVAIEGYHWVRYLTMPLTFTAQEPIVLKGQQSSFGVPLERAHIFKTWDEARNAKLDIEEAWDLHGVRVNVVVAPRSLRVATEVAKREDDLDVAFDHLVVARSK